jgi:hypothetical protein
MKNLILTIAIVIGSLGITNGVKSYSYPTKDASTHTVQQVKSHPVENTSATPLTRVEQTKQTSREQPKIGTIKDMVNGDLMCYVTLIDENNTQHQVGADFELCANKNKFLNQKVRLSYQVVSINDCQSAEPCGKTRKESIITRMEILEEKKSTNSGNSQTISNGEWTITIGNINSWSGVNGTGNLTYRGCDSKGKCINLTGGRIACRNGICTTGWTNGDYSYILQEPMTNPDSPQEPGSSTTLIVRKGSNVILRTTGFKVVAPNR